MSLNEFHESIQDLLQQGLDHKIITHQELVFAACQVVRAVFHLVPEGEDRPRIAIETAEAWCFGSSTLEEVKAVCSTCAYNTADFSTYSAYYAAYYIVFHIAYIVDAIDIAKAIHYASYATTANIIESQQQVKKILLSHLPRLDKLKVWL